MNHPTISRGVVYRIKQLQENRSFASCPVSAFSSVTLGRSDLAARSPYRSPAPQNPNELGKSARMYRHQLPPRHRGFVRGILHTRLSAIYCHAMWNEAGSNSAGKGSQIGNTFPREFVCIRVSAGPVPGQPGQHHRHATCIGDTCEHQPAAHEGGQASKPNAPETEQRAE